MSKISNCNKWIIGVVVVLVVLGGVWYSGALNKYLPANMMMKGGDAESAAATNAMKPKTDTSDQNVMADLASIDTQCAAINPTGGAGVQGPAIKACAMAMMAVRGKLNVRVINAQNGKFDVSALQKSLADVNIQLSNAGSQAQAAMATSTTPAQATVYLQAAIPYLQAARADLAAIYSGLHNLVPATTAAATTTTAAH